MTESQARDADRTVSARPRGPIRRALSRVIRMRRDEEGNSTIEFVILFPLLMLMFFSAAESGVMMIRYVMLERGLDLSVRAIRLGTSNVVEADDVKTMVCNGAGIIPDCLNAVRVEMVQVQLTNWTDLPRTADCVDRNDPARPLRSFSTGGTNDLMVLRVCALFDPMFPLAGLGFQVAKEDGYRYALVSTSAFVMEPG